MGEVAISRDPMRRDRSGLALKRARAAVEVQVHPVDYHLGLGPAPFSIGSPATIAGKRRKLAPFCACAKVAR